MKIKHVLLGFLAVMMLFVTVAGAMALDDGEKVGSPGDFDKYVAVDNDKILSENLPKVPLWQRIFGQSFSFVSIEVDQMNNYACSLDSTHGSFEKPAGKQIRSGSQCDSGQFIAYRSDGGDIPSGHYLFDNLWLKKDSTDLPEFQNYWVNDKSFDYSYACYDCQVSIVDDYEPGCLTKDKTDCVKKSDSSCGTWYGYEKVCLQYVEEGSSTDDSDAPVKITLKDIKVTNGGDLTVNQKYTVSGKAYIDGECDGCVIETGQGYYGTKSSALSIFSNEVNQNACGDDLTVGIKFDAKNELIEFKLYDIATKKGKYSVEIGAYNGCYVDLKDDLRKLDSEKFSIEVTEPQIDSDLDVDDDQSNDVTCYFCRGSDLMSGTYDNSCPDGTSDSEIECGAPSEPDCTNDPDSEACIPRSEGSTPSEDNPVVRLHDTQIPELSWNEEYFDFENNPKTAYSLVAIGVIVLILIIAILASGKKRR